MARLFRKVPQLKHEDDFDDQPENVAGWICIPCQGTQAVVIDDAHHQRCEDLQVQESFPDATEAFIVDDDDCTHYTRMQAVAASCKSHIRFHVMCCESRRKASSETSGCF